MLDSHSLEERGFAGGGGGGGEGFGGGGGDGRRNEAEEEEATGLKVLEGGRWGAGEEAVGSERNCISMVESDSYPISNGPGRR